MVAFTRIRPATPDDALAIATIHVASWRHAYRGILPDDYLDTLSPEQRLPMWARILESPQPGVHVGVLESDAQVVGFYSIGPPDEAAPGDAFMLYTIYMDPGSMGKGYGKLLMNDAESHMRAEGATSGVLRVITANTPTLAFYERCGWSPDPASIRLEDAWGRQVETIRYTKRPI